MNGVDEYVDKDNIDDVLDKAVEEIQEDIDEDNDKDSIYNRNTSMSFLN